MLVLLLNNMMIYACTRFCILYLTGAIILFLSLVKAIRDITPDSTIGFGSFVDKPTEPYIVSR